MVISTIYSNKEYKNNSIFFYASPDNRLLLKPFIISIEERGSNPQYLDCLNCRRRHKLATIYIK